MVEGFKDLRFNDFEFQVVVVASEGHKRTVVAPNGGVEVHIGWGRRTHSGGGDAQYVSIENLRPSQCSNKNCCCHANFGA